MHYEIGQVNRLGNRTSNQDRFSVVETPEGVLLTLADGMGGRARGELAAAAVVKIAADEYLMAKRPLRDPGCFLARVIAKAHRAIIDAAQNAGEAVPGTTGVLCIIQEGKAIWAHVGDSRLYVFHEGLPIYRTTDHSYVEQLYQQGMISRSEQESHPQRNQITQCIGCQPQPPEVTVSKVVSLSEKDIVLLCSDGLWGPLDDAQMGAMLGDGDLEQTLNKMAELAESNSYPRSDNISVVALRLVSMAGTGQSSQGPAQKRRKLEEEPDRVQSAINQIEQVMREYQSELEGGADIQKRGN